MPSKDQYPTAEAFLPRKVTLATLRKAAAGCKGCPLYRTGTQTVFGMGPERATLMLVGEQPGDQEDRAGKPFVGPAGKLLDEVLAEVKIDRNEVYVTNAVKHFKWEPRGTRRIHAKPNSREMLACKPWLMAEIQVIKPRMLICLGATAAQDLLGKDFRITKERGKIFDSTPYAPWLMATYHPSALLRMPDEDARRTARLEFAADLARAGERIRSENAAR